MAKRLIVIAAAALAGSAFMALPSFATGSEFWGTCNTGAKCSGTIEGLGVDVEMAEGFKILCTATGGTATQTNSSSTGTAKFRFAGCVESVFHSHCESGVTVGLIETNSLVSHNVVLETSPSKIVGILFTGVSVTIKCSALGLSKTVTGSIIGEIEGPVCGVAKGEYPLFFQAGFTPRSQKWGQITTTGTVYDLTTRTEPEGAYSTSALTGTSAVVWETGSKVTFDC